MLFVAKHKASVPDAGSCTILFFYPAGVPLERNASSPNENLFHTVALGEIWEGLLKKITKR